MFRKVLGLGGIAIGGLVAFKLVGVMFGLVTALLIRVLFIAALIAVGFVVYKFVSALMTQNNSDSEVEVEVEAEEVSEEDGKDDE